jgi:hypothetical protein
LHDFINRRFEQIRNRPFETLDFGLWTLDLHLKDVLAIAPPSALRTRHENIAEELHLDFLEAGATAFLALALAGIETEGAGVQAALLRRLGRGE